MRNGLYLFLFAVVLMGCATTSTVSRPSFKEIVLIDGAYYIPADSLCRVYNLDYQWDPIAKEIILTKDNKEAKMMVDSSAILLNNQVRVMDREAKFHQGSVIIPHSFVQRSLGPLFREDYIGRKAIPATLGLPIKSVIIDPGHGGRDPGAIGITGLMEKDIVLDIAKRLKRKLNAAGINVILTRETDKFVSLSQRSRIANANAKKVDFFISIHANAARSRRVSGVEVFYLSESVDDNLRSSRAAKNYNLNLKEPFSGKNTEAILWDLMYSDNRKNSVSLAELVCHSLSRSLSQRNRGKKPARFYVLKTNIPTILVEVGFISNRREEKKLRNTSYRNKVAQAIAEGVVQYNRNLTQRRYSHH